MSGGVTVVNEEKLLKRLDKIEGHLQSIASSLKLLTKEKQIGNDMISVGQVYVPVALKEHLTVEEVEGWIKITPTQYLGSNNFAIVMSAIKEQGGEYISAGNLSHFRIPKKR